MSLTIKSFSGMAALLCLLGAVNTYATPIYPGDQVFNAHGETLEERRRFTMHLMKNSPLPTDRPNAAPELANPLGLDREIQVSVLGKRLYHMDLLANSMIERADPGAIDLPPGTMRGIDILDDLHAFYLAYDGRAFDQVIFDVKNAEKAEYRGLPVTMDGTPLSMGDFGVITRARKHQGPTPPPAEQQAEP